MRGTRLAKRGQTRRRQTSSGQDGLLLRPGTARRAGRATVQQTKLNGDVLGEYECVLSMGDTCDQGWQGGPVARAQRR